MRQRSRLSWLKEGDKNTKFFHNFASYRNRANKISILLVGDRRLETKEEIVDHVIAFHTDLFSKEDWDCQTTLDTLEFPTICAADADGLEKDFEEEVKAAVFNLGRDKAPSPDGFPLAFFQIFWEVIKVDVMNFMKEFQDRDKLSKHFGASFITSIAKKTGAESIKDFRPISLIGSIYKILAKELANRLQKV